MRINTCDHCEKPFTNVITMSIASSDGSMTAEIDLCGGCYDKMLKRMGNMFETTLSNRSKAASKYKIEP